MCNEQFGKTIMQFTLLYDYCCVKYDLIPILLNDLEQQNILLR